MKKTLLTLLVAALLAGCSKNRVKPGNADLLVGRWFAVKDTINTFVDNAPSGQTTASYHTDANFVQFNTDGSGTIYISETLPAYSEAFTYLHGSNNQLTLNYPTQMVNGVQQQASTRTGKIKTLTETNLVIAFNTSQVINGKTDSTAEVQYFSIY